MPGRQVTTQHAVMSEGLSLRVTLSALHDAPAAPVILIHGIGMSHRYLSRLHRELARTRTVVSIDLPGFGGVPKPECDPDVPAMAAGIGEVIRRLGLQHAVLVGHSMGSQWAVETAIQNPDHVSRVVVIGPVTDVAHRTAPAQMRALAVDTLREPPWVNAVVFTEYARCGIRWYLTQLRHMLAYPIEERVADLHVPLLIIRGARDPIAGLDWCRLLGERARSARVVIIPGRAHVVQQSAPTAVTAAIFADESREVRRG